MTDTQQGTLDLRMEPLRPLPTYLQVPTIQHQFEDFHASNPFVYEALEALAERLVRRGRQKVGIGMLFEVLRWQWAMQTDDPSSDYKLNNNYRSRYARLLMENHPEWVGLFETRELKA